MVKLPQGARWIVCVLGVVPFQATTPAVAYPRMPQLC